jgi:hypothetical protein
MQEAFFDFFYILENFILLSKYIGRLNFDIGFYSNDRPSCNTKFTDTLAGIFAIFSKGIPRLDYGFKPLLKIEAI